MLFSEYAEIRNNIEELNENSAQIIIDNDLDPQALNELADIILEFNPLALGGAMAGAAAGGIPGAMAGGYAGGKAGQGISKWFKGGQNQKVTPALQAAKQAVGNLVNVLSAAGQAKHGMNVPSQALPQVQQSAQQLNKVLSGMDQGVGEIDKTWNQTQDSSRKSQGGIAQQTQRAGKAIAGNKKGGFRNWLGGAVKNAGNAMRGNKALSQQGGVRGAVAGMGDKMGQWAAKHPRLAGAAKLGATGAAIGAAHAMGAGGAEGGEMDAGGNDMASAGPNAVAPQTGADVASSGADTHVDDPSDQKWALPDSPQTGANVASTGGDSVSNGWDSVDANGNVTRLDNPQIGTASDGGVDSSSVTSPNAGKYAPNAQGAEVGQQIGPHSHDPEGWRDMSPEDYEKMDQTRRDTAMSMGNDDPGPRSQEDQIQQAKDAFQKRAQHNHRRFRMLSGR
jgi:hypothetical protein